MGIRGARRCPESSHLFLFCFFVRVSPYLSIFSNYAYDVNVLSVISASRHLFKSVSVEKADFLGVLKYQIVNNIFLVLKKPVESYVFAPACPAGHFPQK